MGGEGWVGECVWAGVWMWLSLWMWLTGRTITDKYKTSYESLLKAFTRSVCTLICHGVGAGKEVPSSNRKIEVEKVFAQPVNMSIWQEIEQCGNKVYNIANKSTTLLTKSTIIAKKSTNEIISILLSLGIYFYYLSISLTDKD